MGGGIELIEVNELIEMIEMIEIMEALKWWKHWSEWKPAVIEMIERPVVMASIEMNEIIHFNETWQSYTMACGNCHISLIVVVATIVSLSISSEISGSG